MKVAHFTGLGQVAVEDEPMPRLTQPTDVLVRIERAGLCGSDLHYYLHGGIGDAALPFPASLGHECAGTVVEVGRAVKQLAPGDRVAIDPATVCHTCDQCRAGRENTCRHLRFMGAPGEAPGAVAEYRVLPAKNCLPIPKTMSLEQAVLVEPLSVGLYAVRLGEVYPGLRIAILGAGPIGLCVLLAAKVTAPCHAYVTDLMPERLALARAFGAEWTGDPLTHDVPGEIGRREPRGLDLAFECSGDPACIDQALALLAPGGTLVLVGIPEPATVPLDVHAMRRKELIVKNVRRQKGCITSAIRLMRDGYLDPLPMITHHFPLAEIGQAFETTAHRRDRAIKAMIDVQ